ncbi:hypothetical protein G7Z17_g10465 [Cylindrodendrum hubeiense]|uniref:Uncharacterized protein n=1 Tax=Cylindrodendrum hubeiense TaxID=595255 RepID=A0A9P5LCA0_9HYPO|nr:hypothetical protein G7Z17_g10465 [Cylindrodendrum hubeiense]
MLSNPEDNTRLDPKLESDLKNNLGVYYEDYIESIDDVNESLAKLGSQLQCFDALTKERKEEEPLADTIARLRKKTRLSFSMESFGEAYEELSEANRSLKTLREQLYLLKELVRPPKHDHKRHVSGNYGAMCEVRRALKALHSDLKGAWSCTQSTHTRHSIKIFLEAKKRGQPKDSLQIDVVASDIEANTMTHVAHLTVRSQPLKWFDQTLQKSLPSPPSDYSESHNLPKRQKRVSFAEGTRGWSSISVESISENEVPVAVTYDLRASHDACLDLSKPAMSIEASFDPPCFVDSPIESDWGFRHSFYPVSSANDCIWTTKGAYPLHTILNESAREFVSIENRLNVARSIAIAALTYHSTPWLSECWRLRDLSFLAKDAEISSALQTLHMGADLEEGDAAMQGVMTPNSTGLSQATEDELLRTGINNTPLWSLGVALIGIEKWEDLDPANVAEVRKAAEHSKFSEKYRNIVQQCLSCGFGKGHDLENPRLQRAAYMSVVGALEDMIAGHDLNDDSDNSAYSGRNS